MSRLQQSLFEGIRMSLQDALDMTQLSLQLYGERYRHWAVSFSGGKDSSATLAATLYLIEAGLVPKPETLTVLYAELRKPYRRLRKTKPEYNAGGKLVSNLNRLGPMLMSTRMFGMNTVLNIQDEINAAAARQKRPEISLISDEEHDRIFELVEANTWPDKWSGEEEAGDALYDHVLADGVSQPSIFLSGGD